MRSLLWFATQCMHPEKIVHLSIPEGAVQYKENTKAACRWCISRLVKAVVPVLCSGGLCAQQQNNAAFSLLDGEQCNVRTAAAEAVTAAAALHNEVETLAKQN